VSDDTEPAGTLDPERYDRWFGQPWRRHAFSVERDALLDALGPLNGRECSSSAVTPDGSWQPSSPPVLR
jgi:hypothetical protein